MGISAFLVGSGYVIALAGVELTFLPMNRPQACQFPNDIGVDLGEGLGPVQSVQLIELVPWWAFS